MKLPKALVIYLQTGPPPIIWKYNCGGCMFYIDPEECSIVDSAGPPHEGFICPDAWCIIWFPLGDTAPFSWIGE